MTTSASTPSSQSENNSLSASCIVQIGQSPVCRRLVDPSGNIAEEHLRCICRANRGREHLPVNYESQLAGSISLHRESELTFCVVVSCIQSYAILFFNGGVEGALHVVDGLRD